MLGMESLLDFAINAYNLNNQLVWFFAGCSSKQKTPNFILAMTSGTLVGYPDMPLSPSLEYQVFQLKSPLTLYTSFSDSLKLSAYTDEDCKTSVEGEITADSNPVSFSEGEAKFSNVNFKFTDSSKEGLVYIKATSETYGVGYCSPGIS